MSIEGDSFFINAVPPFDFDEINEYYCWDGSDEDESLLQNLDTMVCVEIKELTESLPMEFYEDKSIIDYTIQLKNKKYDPFHIMLPSHLKKRYQCDICFKTYVNTNTFTKHKQRHKKFKCEICNDEFNAKTPLSRHMAILHKKTVPCDFCTKKFYTILELAEHFQKKHDKELKDEEQENINTEEKDNLSQKKNSLDSELDLTLNSFLTQYDNNHEFSNSFSETKNCAEYSNYTQDSPDYTQDSPNYTQDSPNYTESSPDHLKTNSPRYTGHVSNYAPESPNHTLNSTKYTPNSPEYIPKTLKYTPAFPNYPTPNSPNYTPASPNYTTHSPKLSSNENILSDLPEKNTKLKYLSKQKKTMKDFFKTIEKR